MSKMGQELEKRLDENKYKMYEALQKALEKSHNPEVETILMKALAKIERK